VWGLINKLQRQKEFKKLWEYLTKSKSREWVSGEKNNFAGNNFTNMATCLYFTRISKKYAE